MQKAFYGKFTSLKWHINSVREIKPGIILFNFDFHAETTSGEKVESSGVEYVIIHDGRIQHVEVRNA